MRQQQQEKIRESENKRLKQEERIQMARYKNEDLIKKQKMVRMNSDICLL